MAGLALLGGAVAACIEIGTSREQLFAMVVAVLLVGAAIGATGQGRRLMHWANMKTLECAYWIPDIDEGVST